MWRPSLGALAACFFFHRQIASPPSLAAHLLDPPLRGKQFPRSLHLTTSPLTPAASAESADEGPAVQNHSAAVLPGRLVQPLSDTPAPASFRKRRSCRRRASPQPDSPTFLQPAVVSHMDNSSSLTSSVYSLDCVKANLVAQPAARPGAVAQPAAQLVTQSSDQSASHPCPQFEVDMPAGTTLPLFHPPAVSASLSSLPRVAATPSSPPPFAATSPPASHQTAATAALSASPSTSPTQPSSSPPAATASPSSSPDQPSVAAPQPEELSEPELKLSEREEPASPAVELAPQPEDQLSEREEPASPAVELALQPEEQLSELQQELAPQPEELCDLEWEFGELEERPPSREGLGGPGKRAPPSEVDIAVHAFDDQRAVHAFLAFHVQRVGDPGPFNSVACRGCNATGPVAGRRSRNAAATGPVAGRLKSSASITGSEVGRLNCFSTTA
ncbi:uncharacterized protein KIAA0754-like [Oreochromis niloticus]|uniref:uncharacterized protein KIAA0754-like n=1 Tax=Oreochromis niloticus TaxID=8128 RepID=UPI000674DF86|nr:uncharacterized protein KIAA0754-like [Oreochromis niloticus]